jgi:uncharacterized protein with HEPN domain
MQRDASLLLDMFRATSQIVQFKGELTYERFRTDAKTQSAIIHQFLLIGEVAKLISDDFKKNFSCRGSGDSIIKAEFIGRIK